MSTEGGGDVRELLRRYGWHLALAGLALMVPAAMLGTWAYVLVAGVTVLAFANLPHSRDKSEPTTVETGHKTRRNGPRNAPSAT